MKNTNLKCEQAELNYVILFRIEIILTAFQQFGL